MTFDIRNVKYGWKPDLQTSLLKYGFYKEHRMTQKAYSDSNNLLEYVTDVLDQEQLGSCVANSIAGSVHASMVRAGHPDPPWLSRLALYWEARAVSGEQTADNGTYPLNAYQALQ